MGLVGVISRGWPRIFTVLGLGSVVFLVFSYSILGPSYLDVSGPLNTALETANLIQILGFVVVFFAIYLLGELVIQIGEAARLRVFPDTRATERFRRVNSTGGTLVETEYYATERKTELLDGSAIAAILFGGFSFQLELDFRGTLASAIGGSLLLIALGVFCIVRSRGVLRALDAKLDALTEA